MKKYIPAIIISFALAGIALAGQLSVGAGAKMTVSAGNKMTSDMRAWNEDCMNYGHQATVAGDLAAGGAVEQDLRLLKKAGYKTIRTVIACFDDTDARNRTRGIATSSIALGFSTTTYGVGACGSITPTKWTNFKNAVPAEADWAAANGVNLFSIGNEALINNDDVSPTDATMVTDMKTLATNIKTAHPTLQVTVEEAATEIATWNAAGLGDVRYLGINAYGSVDPNTDYASYLDEAIADFTASRVWISEYNSPAGSDDFKLNDQEWATNIEKRRIMAKVKGIQNICYFTYRDGGFGVTQNQYSVKQSTGFLPRLSAVLHIPN